MCFRDFYFFCQIEVTAKQNKKKSRSMEILTTWAQIK